MGIERTVLQFLVSCSRTGVSFQDTLTIGRQSLDTTPRELAEIIDQPSDFTVDDATRVLADSRGWAEPVLNLLGAKAVESLDASDYEGATIVHDLNWDIPAHLEGRYNIVLDGGSLEHVFNFPVAIRNCMRMVRPGGHLLLVTPVNNEAGHGFYQFSPELFYRVLSPFFGYEIERMVLAEPIRRPLRWYDVMDPAAVGARGQFRSREATYLYVRARRIGTVPELLPFPTQSDYASSWTSGVNPTEAETAGVSPSRNQRLVPLRALVPRRLKVAVSRAIRPVIAAARLSSARVHNRRYVSLRRRVWSRPRLEDVRSHIRLRKTGP